jgi:hypothetical protein
MSRRRRWLLVIAGALVLLTGARMGLRYLDWQASEAARAGAPSGKQPPAAALRPLLRDDPSSVVQHGRGNKAR